MQRVLVAILIAALGAGDLAAQKRKKSKKDEEPPTQVLAVVPDPPAAVKVESARLSFYVSPLSAKGLLTQQSKDGLSALRRLARGATIVKLRAFVASRGDARRVREIVSEQFTEWKQPVPALSILQVGGLPLEGAQIQIEAVAEERRPVNMNGVAFLEAKQVVKALGQGGDVNAVRPLLEEALGGLQGELLSVTCYVSSMDGPQVLEQAMAAKFPAAAKVLVQAQRATGSGLARCEAVARRKTGDPDRLVLTGTLIGFGGEDKDVQAVLGRLQKLMEANSASLIDKRGYGVSRILEGKLGPIGVIEGVGSNEATFAIEAVGLQRN